MIQQIETNLVQKAQEFNKVSQRYQPIQTSDIVAQIQAIIPDAAIQTHVPKSQKSTIHIVTITNTKSQEFLGDEVRHRIVIKNSFNGECALSVHSGLYRLVCKNGLTIQEHGVRTSVRHNLKPVQLLDVNSMINQPLNDITEVMQTPIHNPFEVFDALPISQRFKDELRQVYEAPLRVEDSKGTFWCLYNQVNEVMRGRSRSEFSFENKNLNLFNAMRSIVGV